MALNGFNNIDKFLDDWKGKLKYLLLMLIGFEVARRIAGQFAQQFTSGFFSAKINNEKTLGDEVEQLGHQVGNWLVETKKAKDTTIGQKIVKAAYATAKTITSNPGLIIGIIFAYVGVVILFAGLSMGTPPQDPKQVTNKSFIIRFGKTLLMKWHIIENSKVALTGLCFFLAGTILIIMYLYKKFGQEASTNVSKLAKEVRR